MFLFFLLIAALGALGHGKVQELRGSRWGARRTGRAGDVPQGKALSFLIYFFFLRDFIFTKTLFEKLQYLKQEQ